MVYLFLNSFAHFYYLIIYVFVPLSSVPIQHNITGFGGSSRLLARFLATTSMTVLLLLSVVVLAVISAAGVVDVGNFTVDHMRSKSLALILR
jgi:hypothetical protein